MITTILTTINGARYRVTLTPEIDASLSTKGWWRRGEGGRPGPKMYTPEGLAKLETAKKSKLEKRYKTAERLHGAPLTDRQKRSLDYYFAACKGRGGVSEALTWAAWKSPGLWGAEWKVETSGTIAVSPDGEVTITEEPAQ